MIIVQLKGGLGNQMFQYAFGRALSISLGTELKFDTSLFKSDPLRDYSLDCFKLTLQEASVEEIVKLKPEKRKIFPYLEYKIFNKVLPLYKRSYISEKELVDYKELLRIKQNCYLDGYWQSETFFKDIRKTLLKDFILKRSIGGVNKAILSEIYNSNSVSLHIRRGDYVTDTRTNAKHGVLNLDYYDKAMSIMTRDISNPVFYVFSDDISWAKKNLKRDYKIKFVDNKLGKDYEELYLMSNCKHHIIANSSFSWWGAWLSEGSKKMVIAPENWFSLEELKRRRNFDTIVESWVKI